MKGKMPDYYEKWQEQNILNQKIAKIKTWFQRIIHRRISLKY